MSNGRRLQRKRHKELWDVECSQGTGQVWCDGSGRSQLMPSKVDGRQMTTDPLINIDL
jgi:hypothetical protein